MTDIDNDTIKPLDQPIDLLHYLYLLFDTKWIILGAAISAGLLMMEYSRSLPEIYQAAAKVDIIEPGDPGGMDPENRSGSESADLIESGFTLTATKDNYSKIVLARMRSRKFTRYFMDKHNIYTLIYPEYWNSETQRWDADFVLDYGDAFLTFGTQFRSIEQNEETLIVNVGMKHNDPVLAADLANLYVSEFNVYMRNIELAEIRAKLHFLNMQLQQARFIQTEQMLYRLIEVQEAASTIAQGEENYALVVVDPATRAYDRLSPARKKMTIAATIGAAVLTTLAIIALDIVRHVQQTLADYGRQHGRSKLIERRFSVRGRVLRLLFKLGRNISRLFGRKTQPKRNIEEN